MDKNNMEVLEELTLLLLYLTGWKERDLKDLNILRSWKGYQFEVLDSLEEKGYITKSRRAKSVYITDRGIEKAKLLEKKYLKEP